MASPSSHHTTAVPRPAVTNIDSTTLQGSHDTSIIKRFASWIISFLVSLAIRQNAQASEQEPLAPEAESWEDALKTPIDQPPAIAKSEQAIVTTPCIEPIRIDHDIWVAKKEKFYRHSDFGECSDRTKTKRRQLLKDFDESGNTDFWNSVVPEKHSLTQTPPDPLNCSTSLLELAMKCVIETKYARARRELEAVTAELSSGLLKAELAKRNAASQDRVDEKRRALERGEAWMVG